MFSFRCRNSASLFVAAKESGDGMFPFGFAISKFGNENRDDTILSLGAAC
jgi:hypothetical protein